MIYQFKSKNAGPGDVKIVLVRSPLPAPQAFELVKQSGILADHLKFGVEQIPENGSNRLLCIYREDGPAPDKPQAPAGEKFDPDATPKEQMQKNAEERDAHASPDTEDFMASDFFGGM